MTYGLAGNPLGSVLAGGHRCDVAYRTVQNTDRLSYAINPGLIYFCVSCHFSPHRFQRNRTKINGSAYYSASCCAHILMGRAASFSVITFDPFCENFSCIPTVLYPGTFCGQDRERQKRLAVIRVWQYFLGQVLPGCVAHRSKPTRTKRTGVVQKPT